MAQAKGPVTSTNDPRATPRPYDDVAAADPRVPVRREDPSIDPRTAPPPYPEGTSSRQIHNDIRHTRAEMDETIDSLSERLQPRHLLDDVLDWFRGDGRSQAAIRDTGRGILDKVKSNPLPAALIGAGVAWLLAEDSEPRHRYDHGFVPMEPLPEHAGSLVDARTGEPYDESYGAEFRGQGGTSTSSMAPGMMDKAKGTASGIKDKASGMASSAKESMSSTAHSVSESVSSGMQSIKESMSSGASSMRDRASHLSERTRSAGHGMQQRGRMMSDRLSRNYRESRDQLWEVAEDYPLAFGAAAMGLGMILGLAVPRTRQEDELMGEQSDQLKHQAKERGEELLDRGKDIAQSSAAAAADEAEKHGLSPKQLADKASHIASAVANEATSTAKEEAQREGVTTGDLKQSVKDVANRATETAKQKTSEHKKDLKK